MGTENFPERWALKNLSLLEEVRVFGNVGGKLFGSTFLEKREGCIFREVVSLQSEFGIISSVSSRTK